jgi:hypothetical protein
MVLLGQQFSSKYEYSRAFLIGGAGTQTAALAFGGNGPIAVTEEYNGSNLDIKSNS